MTLSECQQQRAALAFSLALVVALLLPAIQNWIPEPKDGFPLSYYPMFTNVRGKTTTVHHAVAVTKDDQRVDIKAAFAGAGGMNTNRRQMRRMVRDGLAPKLAETIASRFYSSNTAERVGATHIEVVESKYNLDGFFHGSTAPVSRVVHASVALPLGEQR